VGLLVYHARLRRQRGLAVRDTACHYLDLVPKGRDEDSLEFTQFWVRYHDKYEE